MKRFVNFIEAVSVIFGGYLMGLLLLLLMVMILVEVVTRYILQSPLSIAEEIGGYILVTMTVMGLGYTWKEGGHVRVTFVVGRLPKRIKNWLRLATVVIATVVSLLMIKAGYDMVWNSSFFGVKSGTWLRTPMKWPQMVLIVGPVLLFVQMIAEVTKAFRIALDPWEKP